jgi:glycosyltransferase involved in cell wall biosynthesis
MGETPKPVQAFSVLICVYKNDNPEQLNAALASILTQTVNPDEIVLVKDGPVGDVLTAVVGRWERKHPGIFQIVELERNEGLGAALRVGMATASNEIIARMDADDLSVPNRFEKQLRFLIDNPDIDVVSSWTGQFRDAPEDILYVRPSPTTPEEIARLAKFRSPITHAAVMYRRSAVMDAGGYCPRYPRMQDYHLWVRMLSRGSRMACIPEALYLVRRGGDFVARRGGLARAMTHVRLQRYFLKIGFISLPRFLINVASRLASTLLPVWLMARLRAKCRI